MKIKSVTRAKNPGEVIEYSAEEKVPFALQDAVAEYPEFKHQYLTFLRDVKVSKLTYSPKGEPLAGRWQNNTYSTEGLVTLHHRDMARDAVLQPRKKSFKLKFEDKLDSNGLPDVKIMELTLE